MPRQGELIFERFMFEMLIWRCNPNEVKTKVFQMLEQLMIF